MKKIDTPLDAGEIKKLKAGDEILLSGVIYTARDQAHKKLAASGKIRPFNLPGNVIYYCGPAKAPKGRAIGTSTTLSANGEQGRRKWPRRAIGSCGPTTSSRMDAFTPALLKAGLKGMIGKGSRSKEVIAAIKKYKAVYFLAPAGCGALLSRYVRRAKAIAFKELGPEAIYRLEVKDFPLVVGVDCKGRSIYGKKRRAQPR